MSSYKGNESSIKLLQICDKRYTTAGITKGTQQQVSNMTLEERLFLHYMERIEEQQRALVDAYKELSQLEEDYRAHQNKVNKHYKNTKDFKFAKENITNQMLSKTRATLGSASRVLGLLAHFDIVVDKDGLMHIIPKNEAAERMMKRYEALYMERELSR